MDRPMTCKELAEILLNTPDKPVVISKAKVDGDMDGNIWLGSYQAYLEKQYIKTVTLKDGTEAIILNDEIWA